MKIDLPGVWENVQEDNYTGVVYELDGKVGHDTLDILHDPAFCRAFEAPEGLLRTSPALYSYIPLALANPTAAPALINKVALDVASRESSGTLPPGLAEQLEIQLKALRDDASPGFEIAMYPGSLAQIYSTDKVESGKKYAIISFFINRPFSSGTIHSASKIPTASPEIDQHCYENNFDLEMHVQAFKVVRAIANIEPWKSTILPEVEPGPSCTTDDQIHNFLKVTVSAAWHAVGSCSMLPRDKLGVVDPKLKVYGTKNLQVVDLSVIPLHVRTHTQGIAYFIAEQAADMILGNA